MHALADAYRAADYWNRDIPAQTAQQTLVRILQKPNNSTDNRRQP